MLDKLIEIAKEHKTRLEVLLNHRDMKPQLASYIKEFLLNKDFEDLLKEISQKEESDSIWADDLKLMSDKMDVAKMFGYVQNEKGLGYDVSKVEE